MHRLVARSLLVLALLFGLLFAVGIAVLYHYHFPLSWAIWFSIAIVTLQFLLSPFITDIIFKIRWMRPDEAPELAAYLVNLCAKRNMPVPRVGIIEDGNPNAFTYGHVPGDARLVITRGLMEMLSPEELQAVVAHEVGHIRHYDFIVMSFAALVPMLLYVIYAWVRGQRSNQLALVIGIGAYIAYIASQFIVLMLSRVREYFADDHAAQSVEHADAIASALIKIAYGMARIPQVVEKNDKAKNANAHSRATMAGAMGICNLQSGGSLALCATDADGLYSPEMMLRAAQWDLHNPWGRLFELQSTHPLIARRVQAAVATARRLGQQAMFPAELATSQVNLWPAFLRDLLFLALPWLGLATGLFLAQRHMQGSFLTRIHPFYILIEHPTALGWPLLLLGLGWLARLAYSFGSGFRPARITDLLGELQVSRISAIPVKLTGQIIGRGVPGLFWSKDLVLQDESGFITLLYRQPISLLETLFGLISAKEMVGKQGTVRGWYRRGPTPYLELNNIDYTDGTRSRCYRRHALWALAALVTLVGAALLCAL